MVSIGQKRNLSSYMAPETKTPAEYLRCNQHSDSAIDDGADKYIGGYIVEN